MTTTKLNLPLAIATIAVSLIALFGFTGGGMVYAQAAPTPVISNIVTSSTNNGTGATITWTTDQPSDSQVMYGPVASGGYTTSATPGTDLVTNHSVSLSGLTPGTTYHFQITSNNSAGISGISADQEFTASSGTTTSTSTPAISGVTALSTTEGTGATITWTTDQPASSQVMYGLSEGNYPASTTPVTDLVTNHSVSLGGLNPGTTYHFQVTSNNSGGVSGTSANQTFTTASGTTTGTTTAPSISSIVATSNSDGTGATITWTTDQPASSQVMYGLSSGNYTASTTLGTNLVTSHTAFLGGLTSGTTYHFQVMSNNSGGVSGTSANQTFTTSGTTTGTTTPAISAVTALSNSAGTGATITWITNQPASSQVLYGLTSGNYTSSTTPVMDLVGNHSVTLTGLTPATTYHFQVVSNNSGGVSGTSADQTFTTASGTTTGTTTPPTGDLDVLRELIRQILQQISILQAQIQQLISSGGTGGGGSGGGTTTPASATVTPNNASVRAGTTIDFNGRNFGVHENVTVTSDGQTVTTAFADLGGNFTTGSLPVPQNTGTKTYTFVGQNSGVTRTVTITIIP